MEAMPRFREFSEKHSTDIAPEVAMPESRKLNFTKAALAALPPAPAGKRVYVHDTKTKGLVLAITDRGVKSFQLYRWVNKRPERLTLGRFDDNGLTIEQARKAAADHSLSIARGENPAQEKRKRSEEMTLRDLFDEYLVRQASVNRRLDKHRQTFRLYLTHWEGRRLSEISHDAVSRWHKALPAKIAQASIDSRRERERQAAKVAKKAEDKAKAVAKAKEAGRRPRATGRLRRVELSEGFRPKDGRVSANIALKLLHTLYQRAIREWRIYKGENPASGIKKFPEASRERFLQADELPRFFEAVAAEENPDIRDYVNLLLLTGARRSSLLSMRWDDVNLERAEWRIPALRSKTGIPMTVPLVAAALEILKSRHETAEDGAGFVFPGTGGSGHLADPKKGWARILARAGIRDLRIHDLRRSLGSWQAATGASLQVIGKSLGHRNLSTTMIYSRLNLDPVRDAMERATNAMQAAASARAPATVKRLRTGRRASD